MTQHQQVEPAVLVQAPARARRWTGRLLRLLFTLQATMTLAQPLVIGRYLDGDFDQLGTHQLIGLSLPGTALLCTLAALCHWAIGRGRSWPVWAASVLMPLEVAQLAAGYTRKLALHIPLGTVIVAATVVLAVWSWTPRVHRTRPRSA